MSTIKGIFEPFYNYVSNQLNARKALLFPFELADYGIVPEKGIRNQRAFHAYTTEKQCVIRMASGVDIREKNTLLADDERLFIGKRLAQNWVLEGGNKTYKGFDSSYNSKKYRSNPQDGFGMVPPPGITDATIDTKSEDGSLREATINFVCHNRRQLEVLEALYMRPGYCILLEWGWDPYIKFKENFDLENEPFSVNENDFSVLSDFFKSESTINSLNDQIFIYKSLSQGNYDGFIGFIKNFSFKVREDGGYDCMTSVIAHGEILDSLKATKSLKSKLFTTEDEEIYKSDMIWDEKVTTDEFLFLLKSIKANLDKAGDKAIIEYTGTDREEQTHTIYDEILIAALREHKRNLLLKLTVGAPITLLQGLGYIPTLEETLILEAQQEAVSIEGIRKKQKIFYKNKEGDPIPIHKLNDQLDDSDYFGGFEKIKKLIRDVAKFPNLEKEDIENDVLLQSKEDWEDYPKDISRAEKEDTWAKKGWNSFSDWANSLIGLEDKGQSTGERYLSSGFDPLFEGLILKEISVSDRSEDSSGIKKKIFVRWDLICQILNKEITPEYKKDHAIVELTYLNPNEQTYTRHESESEQEDNSFKKDDGRNKFYLQYALPDNKDLFHTDNGKPSPDDPNLQMTDVGINLMTNQVKKIILTPQPPILGQSLDSNVCLMPHQIPTKKWWNRGTGGRQGRDKDKRGIRQFTSFINTQYSNTDIGLVYFNLDHLISTYESLVLEEYTTSNALGEKKTKTRLKKEFSFHDWITTIWNDVNDACAGFYDFKLHVEHSRPNVVRIIDFTFKGKPNDISDTRPIFEFDPQGLSSITRESDFSSKIDNDFSSVISIAAQSPNSIHSLEAMSFKAFHKNIRNRFTSLENDEKGKGLERVKQFEQYNEDLNEYNNAVESLKYYITKMKNSNYESELLDIDSVQGMLYRTPINSNTAKQFAGTLEEMRNALEARHPYIDSSGSYNNKPEGKDPKQPFIGSFREDTTYSRSAIIPITTSMTLDGIAGIHPLQIFKINKDKLPLGYQNPNIVFIVKKETQKISSGQDWTTDITGYLTMLNGEPNNGLNPPVSNLSSNSPTSANLDLIDNERPQADLLRGVIKKLNSEDDFTITEKYIEQFNPHGELSSGGDLDPSLVTEAKNIFEKIMFNAVLYVDGGIKVEITAGNDDFHTHQEDISSHIFGKGLDFNVDPYTDQTEEIIEDILKNNPNISYINEYTTPTKNSTGDHFHFQLI